MTSFFKLAFLTCLLVGCAQQYQPNELSTQTNPSTPGKVTPETLKTPTSPTSNPKGTISNNKVSSWNLSGGMAARNNTKGWTAAINWQQQGLNRYHIRLSGPLGSGTIIIERNGGAITYIDGTKRISSQNADKLLQQQTGVRLPVNSLYYWVRGLPAPGSITAQQTDNNQNLVLLKQAGYNIHYADYSVISGASLPRKIHLDGHGVIIKLVIKHWQI